VRTIPMPGNPRCARRTLHNKASLEQIQADRVTADFDAAYGNGFIKSEKFVEMLYQDLSR